MIAPGDQVLDAILDRICMRLLALNFSLQDLGDDADIISGMIYPAAQKTLAAGLEAKEMLDSVVNEVLDQYVAHKKEAS